MLVLLYLMEMVFGVSIPVVSMVIAFGLKYLTPVAVVSVGIYLITSLLSSMVIEVILGILLGIIFYYVLSI